MKRKEVSEGDDSRTRKDQRSVNLDARLCDSQSGAASSDSEKLQPSVQEILRRKIQGKKSSQSIVKVSREKDRQIVENWYQLFTNAGYCCDLTGINNENSPFATDHEDSNYPEFALSVFASKTCHYEKDIGPFNPVRLIIIPDGTWRLQCEIFGRQNLKEGQLLSLSDDQELISLADTLFTPSHRLCPGLIGLEEVQDNLGYIPENVVVSGVCSLHSKKCKMWHTPSEKALVSESEDKRWPNVCSECRRTFTYVQRKIKEKKNLDPATRLNRQHPSSHYKIKYLSPASKKARYSRLREDRKALKKRVRKFYKKTKVELPEDQSNELCQLIEAIESSDNGKQELESIEIEGEIYRNKEDVSSGEILRNVWQKDRDSFFRDQRKNVTGKRGNRWSLATIRMALAVYSRSPSAYEALRHLHILQLPCSKVLKSVIKDGAEKPGIDESYLKSQQEKFSAYQQQRERSGHPRPLGLGVLMWDEVKIQMKVAWNLKGAGITGFTMTEDELKVLHDVFNSTIQPGAQKASYIVQFLWRDLTSGYDVVGPYFPVESSIKSGVLQEFIMLSLKAFHGHGFKVTILLCDGASSNLSVLKLLTGHERAQFPVNHSAETLMDKYFVKASFPNPEDPCGWPIFVMICPSHQLKNMIAALYSSRPSGSKSFLMNGTKFGWETVQAVFKEEMQRAEEGRSRKVPGLKYAFVYRDSWTRLNVRPAKIMQQRFMITATLDLNGAAAANTAKYLDACNLLFERGILSRRRVNSIDSQVLINIRNGMKFFETWCETHSRAVYPDNSKRARQKLFLAWQTWDLLRVVIHGFLAFCEWFFTHVSPSGQYFISPLRINGSALESIFSTLKHASGGNLSALSYGPSLGKLIYRKGEVVKNKNSERGYRDVVLNVDGSGSNSDTYTNTVLVSCTRISSSLVKFYFPDEISQSTLGGRQGSNACTIIAVVFGSFCKSERLDISLLWPQLPQVWTNCLINAICEGNKLYDDLYANAAVYLDVDDVVSAFGNECNIQCTDPTFDFTDANNYASLINYVNTPTAAMNDRYGVMIGCNKSVGIYVKPNGLSALIDSHRVSANVGGVITISDNFASLFSDYVGLLHRQNNTLSLGTLTWIEYTSNNN